MVIIPLSAACVVLSCVVISNMNDGEKMEVVRLSIIVPFLVGFFLLKSKKGFAVPIFFLKFLIDAYHIALFFSSNNFWVFTKIISYHQLIIKIICFGNNYTPPLSLLLLLSSSLLLNYSYFYNMNE